MSRIDGVEYGVGGDQRTRPDNVEQFGNLHDVESDAGDRSRMVFVGIGLGPRANRAEDFFFRRAKGIARDYGNDGVRAKSFETFR